MNALFEWLQSLMKSATDSPRKRKAVFRIHLADGAIVRCKVSFQGPFDEAEARVHMLSEFRLREPNTRITKVEFVGIDD